MSRSPVQSSLISLKSDDNVILKNRNKKDINDDKTKEICNNFFKNSNVNPITGRMIKENGSTYKSFLKKCSKYKNNN